MDELTKQEKEQAIKAFEQRQARQFKFGKAIVFTIAAVNILSALVSAFYNFNLISMIIQIVLSVALFAGISWVRYLFAGGAALSTMIIIYALTSVGFDSGLSVAEIVIVLACLVYSVASCIVLFASKSVSEFLYSQKNG
ncbi:MAG: hypothetical protein N2484_02415 [Clostridia bacterium]|nr:hypothetical protein [Clostridia bacterium]